MDSLKILQRRVGKKFRPNTSKNPSCFSGELQKHLRTSYMCFDINFYEVLRNVYEILCLPKKILEMSKNSLWPFPETSDTRFLLKLSTSTLGFYEESDQISENQAKTQKTLFLLMLL